MSDIVCHKSTSTLGCPCWSVRVWQVNCDPTDPGFHQSSDQTSFGSFFVSIDFADDTKLGSQDGTALL